MMSTFYVHHGRDATKYYPPITPEKMESDKKEYDDYVANPPKLATNPFPSPQKEYVFIVELGFKFIDKKPITYDMNWTGIHKTKESAFKAANAMVGICQGADGSSNTPITRGFEKDRTNLIFEWESDKLSTLFSSRKCVEAIYVYQVKLEDEC